MSECEPTGGRTEADEPCEGGDQHESVDVGHLASRNGQIPRAARDHPRRDTVRHLHAQGVGAGVPREIEGLSIEPRPSRES
jgi:hypothetical protein